MTKVQEHFGARVRYLRKARGWSQEELARRTARHWTYIGGVERGERNPSLRVIADIAKAFGVPIRDLFPARRGS
ncbi:MAG: helix-turn-helix transcriptional regulator [Phycisphaerae bacterium]